MRAENDQSTHEQINECTVRSQCTLLVLNIFQAATDGARSVHAHASEKSNSLAELRLVKQQFSMHC